MKKLRPNTISVWIAMFIALIITAIFYFFQNWLPGTFLKLLLFFFLSAFVIFVIISYLLGQYIEKRLKPIFKIIREVPLEQIKKSKQEPQKPNYSLDVNDEISKWATHKQEEIKRLKELERYRKEFVGNVSHELKTPIFNIQGYILTLLEGGIDDPRINQLYLQRTVKSIDRMISIVEDLESINKLESGVFKLNKEMFDIVKLVEDVFDIEHLLAKERKIKLEFSTRTDKPVFVNADKKRITEVLTNLVVNAIKYGKKGGEVKIGFFDIDDHVMVEVRDTGIGIEKEQLPRIFERFYRIDKHRSREQGGTGLGLAIVKHIIEAHEQTIDVKSQPDVGSTFTFTLEKVKN